MLGKISAIALIVLGIYILAHVFTGRSNKEDKGKGAELYHIGCYDIDRPLTHSQDIALYLNNLSALFNSTAPEKVSTLSRRIAGSVFTESGGNELARSFQKYIASYQNIKSRNQYQQAYFNTLKQTKDEFLQCREHFNQHPWECRNVSHQYNSTDQRFKQLKELMQGLMIKKAQHLTRTEELLKDEDVGKDAEYTEKYTQDIDLSNNIISKRHQKIKKDNESMLNLNNQLYRTEVELNSTKNILSECQKNKAEIDFCHNISEYVRGLYDQRNLEEIMRSMKQKRFIIDLINSHIIQSKKLGDDTTSMQQELEETKRQLEEQELLYHQTSNTGKCAYQLQMRCSHDNIIKLQNNVTSLSKTLVQLLEDKEALQKRINSHLYEIEHHQQKINRLTEELKNSAVDLKHLKLKEDRKKRQLQEYRSNLTQISLDISDVSRQIAQLNLQRTEQNQKIDRMMQRGEELLQCLSKKELLLKLDAKKPKFTTEDQILKQEATRSLSGVIKKLLKQQ